MERDTLYPPGSRARQEAAPAAAGASVSFSTGPQGYFFNLHYRIILKPSAPRVLQGEGEREVWKKRGLVGVVTPAPKKRLERVKKRLLSVPFP